MQKGKPTTAGSKILEGFTAPFDAEVISRLDEQTERAALSEFGLGSPGELPSPMLCSDVFGHIRRQADKQGLCYIRPAYGTVSRYGLIPTAPSMDQIGVVAQTPGEGFALLEKISGCDDKDGAMLRGDAQCAPETAPVAPQPGGDLVCCADICEQVLYILAYAEISSSVSRYDGIKYGRRAAGQDVRGLNSLYLKTRTEGFGSEAKLAAVVGAMVLSQAYYEKYYEKAMKIRRLIKEAVRFGEAGITEVPVESHLAVLCGLPSVTFNGKQLLAAAEGIDALKKAVGV
jgi:aspartyl-tRNA(Asn)/glutamyl-tRNA(Gln) amidotransferase subunit A